MTDIPKHFNKIRGSASAFMYGDLAVTRYSTGCLRNILIKSKGFKESIDPIHMERGLLNEDLYAQQLAASGCDFDREKSLDERIGNFTDTFFVGRLDFVVREATSARVDELKSTESSSVLNETIRKGKYKPENLAQLVAYMITERLTEGRLIYTYYKRDKNTKILKQDVSRTFEVMIGDDGSILVDSVRSPFTVHDQLQHRQAAANCIANNVVGPRPYKAASKFDGPCGFCIFKTTCEKFDNGEIASTEDFIADATQQSKG